MHVCVLAYFSDLYAGLPTTFANGHIGGPRIDHALWFHRTIRTDDWFLMSLELVSSAYGRGVYRGAIRDRQGRLAATLGQEMLYSTSRPSLTMDRL
jgi:acyl-CoA thioesterase-2